MTYQRISTLVTIISDGLNEASNVDLRIEIRFYDFVQPLNETKFGKASLSCASVKIPNEPNRQNIQESLWTRNDCELKQDSLDGTVVCDCNKTGTFALIQYTTYTKVCYFDFCYRDFS